MPSDPTLRAHQEWLGYIQPVGLVVSPAALVAAGCVPDRNVSARQETLRGLLTGDPPRLLDFPTFTREFLGWQESDLAGAPGGPPLPESLSVALPNEHDTLRPTYAVPDPDAEGRFLLLVSVAEPGTDLDDAGARSERDHGDGWHASPEARLERLLRETGVPAGLLASGDDLAGIRLPGLTCLYQGWLGGERLSDEELGAPCVRALERHGVVLPRRFDALVSLDKPRAGFHGILLEARSGAQSFGDTVHQLKAYRAALRGQLPGPLLVWGVVESGGDRTRAFDAEALRKAALEREHGQDLWLFTSEEEIRVALEAAEQLPSERTVEFVRL